MLAAEQLVSISARPLAYQWVARGEWIPDCTFGMWAFASISHQVELKLFLFVRQGLSLITISLSSRCWIIGIQLPDGKKRAHLPLHLVQIEPRRGPR